MPKRKPTNDGGRAAKTRAIATPPAAGATAADGQTARRLQFSRDRSREARAASPELGESEEEVEESEASSTDSSVESAGEDAGAAANADAQTAEAAVTELVQSKTRGSTARRRSRRRGAPSPCAGTWSPLGSRSGLGQRRAHALG